MPFSTTNVFLEQRSKTFPLEYRGVIRLTNDIFGGVPSNPNVAEGWLKTKLGLNADNRELAMAVAKTVQERGVSTDEAIKIVNMMKNLNGFKRGFPDGHPDADDPTHPGYIYIEGRQLKAALKEAASVAVAGGLLDARGWGLTNKSLKSFLPEHVFVIETRLFLLTEEGEMIRGDDNERISINQSFITTYQGTGIQYTERVSGAYIQFHVRTSWKLDSDQWAVLWNMGGSQGLGATRSQGWGTYEVVEWEILRDDWEKYRESPRKVARSKAAMKAAETAEAKFDRENPDDGDGDDEAEVAVAPIPARRGPGRPRRVLPEPASVS